MDDIVVVVTMSFVIRALMAALRCCRRQCKGMYEVNKRDDGDVDYYRVGRRVYSADTRVTIEAHSPSHPPTATAQSRLTPPPPDSDRGPLCTYGPMALWVVMRSTIG